MKSVSKGKPGYIQYNKKKRVIISLILLIIPIAAYVAAYIYNGTNKNIITVIAMVGLIPACRSIVNTVMFFTIRSIPKDILAKVEAHKGILVCFYELYITTREKNALLDATVICGNSIVGLCTFKKFDKEFIEKHITNSLRAAGYSVNVTIMSDVDKFIERLDSLNAHADSLREGVRFKADERYPELTGEELAMHNLMAVAL